jgi:antitoxin VapB
MAMNIKNLEAEKLADDLARRMGTSKTEAVIRALRDKIATERLARGGLTQREKIEALIKRAATLPVLDKRSADAILGYDDDGLPR